MNSLMAAGSPVRYFDCEAMLAALWCLVVLGGTRTEPDLDHLSDCKYRRRYSATNFGSCRTKLNAQQTALLKEGDTGWVTRFQFPPARPPFSGATPPKSLSQEWTEALSHDTINATPPSADMSSSVSKIQTTVGKPGMIRNECIVTLFNRPSSHETSLPDPPGNSICLTSRKQ